MRTGYPIKGWVHGERVRPGERLEFPLPSRKSSLYLYALFETAIISAKLAGDGFRCVPCFIHRGYFASACVLSPATDLAGVVTLQYIQTISQRDIRAMFFLRVCLEFLDDFIVRLRRNQDFL